MEEIWNKIDVQNNSLINLIDEVNQEIFNWELTEIFEVTYAYEWWFNKTLFLDSLNIGSNIWDAIKLEDKQKTLKEVYDKTFEKLDNKFENIKKYLNKINEIKADKEENQIIKELLKWSLEYWLNILEITKKWLIFEIEKAWFESNLTVDGKQKIINKIKKLEEKTFWWEIKNNPEEVVLVYEYLKNKFDLNINKLTKSEQKKYLDFLNIAKKYLAIEYKESDFNTNKKVEYNNKEDFLNKDIKRESYVKILQYVFDLLKLDIEVIVEERASIYDWEKHLWIPKNKNYDYLTIKRLLELISHEIEAHTINLRNNQKLIWKFRSAANLEKEEWVAMTMEKLLNWQNIDKIWIPQHFPKVFMWEILNWDELKEFLYLNNKIEDDKWYAWRFFRLKRNYDLNLPWVQHKDTSYWRWVLKTIKFLKELKEEKEKWKK